MDIYHWHLIPGGYAITKNGQSFIAQTCKPGEPGLQDMTREEAEAYATAEVERLRAEALAAIVEAPSEPAAG
jgi:hypothetical protein